MKYNNKTNMKTTNTIKNDKKKKNMLRHIKIIRKENEGQIQQQEEEEKTKQNKRNNNKQ